MANVSKAIEFMLRQEDAKLSGVISDVSSDHGGLTRFGLTARFHPALEAAGFFSPSMPEAQALPLAEQTYETEYAKPLRLARLSSDVLACGLLSFALLDGIGSAVKLLRAALYSCGFNIAVTNALIDDATFDAELTIPEARLIPALVSQQRIRCEHIAVEDPSQEKFIRGWENRANQVLALVRA